jgi:hypothetical protein
MPMVFPTSPIVGQVFTSGGRSWVWSGSTWDSPSQTGIPAEYITSGKLAQARMPSGSILQVVTASSSTEVSSTSSGYISIGLSVSITPLTTNSRIAIFCNIPVNNATSSSASIFELLRNSTNLGTSSASFRPLGFGQAYSSAGSVRSIISMHFVDSPGTTAAITYEANMIPQSGGATAMHEGRKGTITIMEIAG